MEINDYIDWQRMWEDVKNAHLQQYPTLESYTQDNKDIIKDLSFAKQMYEYLLDTIKIDSEATLNCDEELEAYIPNTDILVFCFGLDETTSNENGTEYGGYEWVFEFSKEWNCFKHFEVISYW